MANEAGHSVQPRSMEQIVKDAIKAREAEKALLKQTRAKKVVPPPKGDLDFSEKARLSAQGALFNLSDEGLALLRSLLGEDYDAAVADERAKLEAARDKPGSLKYEIGGAIVPALAAAPFTGGASIPLTALRFWAVDKLLPLVLVQERGTSLNVLPKTLQPLLLRQLPVQRLGLC